MELTLVAGRPRQCGAASLVEPLERHHLRLEPLSAFRHREMGSKCCRGCLVMREPEPTFASSSGHDPSERHTQVRRASWLCQTRSKTFAQTSRRESTKACHWSVVRASGSEQKYTLSCALRTKTSGANESCGTHWADVLISLTYPRGGGTSSGMNPGLHSCTVRLPRK